MIDKTNQYGWTIHLKCLSIINLRAVKAHKEGGCYYEQRKSEKGQQD